MNDPNWVSFITIAGTPRELGGVWLATPPLPHLTERAQNMVHSNRRLLPARHSGQTLENHSNVIPVDLLGSCVQTVYKMQTDIQ